MGVQQRILNFALLGRGKFGRNYYRILRTMRGVSLKSVVTAQSGNLNKVLRDPSIHCVVVATPPKTHFRIARAAILAGKHVLVEKPMVVRVRDAKVLQALVKKSGVTFMVGHQYLYNEDVRRIKKRIDSGNIGKPLYMLADHASSGERKDVDVVWDTAPHALSIFQYFFNPTKIVSASVHKSSDGGFVSADVLFDRGPVLCMRSAWRAPEKVRKITVVGDKRAAILDETLERNKLKFFYPVRDAERDDSYDRADCGTLRVARFSAAKISNGVNPAYVPPLRTATPLRNELEHFISCVRSGRKPLTDVEHGFRIIKFLDRISSHEREV